MGVETAPVGWRDKMKAPYIKGLMYRRGLLPADCISAADIRSYTGARVFCSLSVNWMAVTSYKAANNDLTLSLCQPQEPCSSSQPIKGSYPPHLMKELQIGSYLLVLCTIKASVHKLASMQKS